MINVQGGTIDEKQLKEEIELWAAERYPSAFEKSLINEGLKEPVPILIKRLSADLWEPMVIDANLKERHSKTRKKKKSSYRNRGRKPSCDKNRRRSIRFYPAKKTM